MNTNIRIKERIISFLLTTVFITSMFPTYVSADDGDVTAQSKYCIQIVEQLSEDESVGIVDAEVEGTVFVDDADKGSFNLTSSSESEALGVVDLTTTLSPFEDSILDEAKTVKVKFSVKCTGYRDVIDFEAVISASEPVVNVELKREYNVTYKLTGPGKLFYKNVIDDDWSEWNDTIKAIDTEKFCFRFQADTDNAQYNSVRISGVKINGVNQEITNDMYWESTELFSEDTEISAEFSGYYSIEVISEESEGIDSITINGDSSVKMDVLEGTDNCVVISAKTRENTGGEVDYVIENITVNNAVPADFVKKSAEYTYNIENISENISIKVTLLRVYRVTVEYTADNGAVFVNNDNLNDNDPFGVVSGIVGDENITLTAVPNDSSIDGKPYTISSVSISSLKNQTVDEMNFDETGKYVPNRNYYNNLNPFNITLSVDQDITAEIVFTPYVFEIGIDVDTDIEGTIELSTPSVEYGSKAEIIITPNDDYYVEEIRVNGNQLVKTGSEDGIDYYECSGIDAAFEISYDVNNDKRMILTQSSVVKDETVYIKLLKADVSYSDISIEYQKAARVKQEDKRSLYVLAPGGSITIKPNKEGYNGISLYRNPKGDISKLEINKDDTIKKLYLFRDTGSNYFNQGIQVDLSDKPIVILYDSSAPKLEVGSCKEYYTTDTVKLSINADDVVESGSNKEDKSSGIKAVKYEVTYSNIVLTGASEQSTEPVSKTEYISRPIGSEDIFHIDTDIDIGTKDYDYAEVKLTVTAIDNADNQSNPEIREFKIYKYTPDIKIKSFDENSVNNYYQSRKYEVSVQETRIPALKHLDSDIFNQDSKLLSVTYKDAEQNESMVMPKNIVWAEQDDSDKEQGIKKAIITFPKSTFSGDGYYSWEVNYKNKLNLTDKRIDFYDKNGNKISSSANAVFKSFVIDNEAPQGTISYSDNTWARIVDTITFGIFSNRTMTVSTSVSDNLSESDNIQISYYKYSVTEDLATTDFKYTPLSDSELNALYLNSKFESQPVEVSKDETFVVYARFEDQAGNVSYANTLGLIYDKTGTERQIVITPENGDAENYYNGDINVKIYVTDKTDESGNSYSGLKKIQYEVKCTDKNNNTSTTQKEVLLDTASTSDTASVEGELIPEFEKIITISADKNNSDNIELIVSAVDNAENSFSKTQKFHICADIPTVEVTFNDDKAINVYAADGFFKTKRKATITITDRESVFDELAAKSCIHIFKSIDWKNSDVHSAYTIGEWVNNGNKHTITVDFEKDAYYGWKFEPYTNKAGSTSQSLSESNADDKTNFSFVIDTIKPTGTIKYEDDIWRDLLEVITFGIFSKDTIVVSAEPDDEDLTKVSVNCYKETITDDIKDFDYKYTTLTDEELEEKYKNHEFKDSPLRVTQDETFVVYARFEDEAGNISYVNTSGLIFDATGSSNQITFDPDACHSNDYYNRNFKVKVCVKEKTVESDNSYSGLKTVRYIITCDGKVTKDELLLDTNNADYEHSVPGELKSELSEVINISANANNSDDVSLTVMAEDNAGNKYQNAIYFKINTTAPTVDISFDENEINTKAAEGFFRMGRTATITIHDRATSFDEEAAVKSINIIKSVNQKGEKVTPSYSIGNWTHSGDDHSIDVFFGRDAYYQWEFKPYKNKAGLFSDYMGEAVVDDKTMFDFVIDSNAPYGTIRYQDNIWDGILDVITFGLFSNDAMDIYAVCENDLTNITVSYYKDVLNADLKASDYRYAPLSVKQLEEKNKNGEFKTSHIIVSKDETFVVYARFEDQAGNLSYVSTAGLIYDDTGSGDQITFDPDDCNANDYYNKDFNVVINVTEKTDNSGNSYSGLKKISYEVKNNGKITEQKQLLDTTKSGYTPSVEGELLSEFSKKITISSAKNNSDAVELIVYAEDNAGNTYENSIGFKINIDLPTVKVSFDDDEANVYGADGFFKTDRTATITIHDRATSFDEVAAKACIKINKAATETGEPVEGAYSIGSWANTGDDHVITVHFKNDAYFNWEFTPYTNKAGNTSKALNETNADDKINYSFAIDMEAPTGVLQYKDLTWGRILEILTFGVFSNQTMKVEVKLDRDLTEVAVAYYKDLIKTDIKESDYKYTPLSDSALEEKYINNQFKTEKVTVSKDETFVVYARFEDQAGNITYVNTTGLIYDATGGADQITIEPENYHSNDYYNKDFKVKISVTEKTAQTGESYSGLKKIQYQVRCNNKVTKEAYLLDITSGSYKPETENELISDYTNTITISAAKNNSDKVELVVTAEDNAGNVYSNSHAFKINVTAPEISIAFDDSENDVYNIRVENERGYFNRTRTATITVKDRSDTFDENIAQQSIKVNNACDAKGNKIADSYAIGDWEHNGDDHIVKVTFIKDSNYNWQFMPYTNLAGMTSSDPTLDASDVTPFVFTVDKENAPVGDIVLKSQSWKTEYSSSVLFSDVNRALFFRLFSNISVDVSAENLYDEISPFEVFYYKTDIPVALTKSELDLMEWNTFIGSELETNGVFPNDQFVVYLKLIDYAGNYCYINSEGCIVTKGDSELYINVDTTPNENGLYGRSYLENGIDVTFTVEESIPYAGVKSMEYWLSDGNKKSEPTVIYTFSKQNPIYTDLERTVTETFNIEGKELIEFNSSNTEVYVKVVDNANNEIISKQPLDIDVTSPEIKAEFIEISEDYSESGYFVERKAIIYITERASNFSSENVEFSITATDYNGNTVENPYTVTEWTTVYGDTPDEDVHSAVVRFNKDGNFRFNVKFTDDAGNSNDSVDYGTAQYYDSFTVDTLPPVGVLHLDDHSWNYLFTEVLKDLTFGIFKNTKIDVSVDAQDDTSPFDVEYYLTDRTTALSVDELNALTEDKWLPFYYLQEMGIVPNDRVTVYIRLTDYAGNIRYINSNGVIADNVSSEIELIPESANENDIYGISYDGTINVNFTVKDKEPYSGLKTVEYWTVDDGIESEHKNLYNIKDEIPNVENENGYPLHEDLKARYSDTIVLDQAEHNHTGTKLYIKAVDNAENESVEFVTLDIDVTAPKIKVEYSETVNESAVEGYYTQREAKVIITERSNHFDPSKVKFDITSVDIDGNDVKDSWTLGEWQTNEKEKDDDATHTAIIKFNKEANYTFDVSYVDNAGNNNEAIDVSSQKTPFTFTVDRTSPTGTITSVSAEGREEKWTSLVDPITFGFWSREFIKTTATNADKTSPIKSVEYYMVSSKNATDNTSALTKQNLDEILDWQPFEEISVTANKQFIVYLKIKDNAGNYTYLSTNGLIVDDKHPLAESVAPEISVSPQFTKNGIYSGSVKVDVEVVDPTVGGTYSGLKEISYSVFDRASAAPNTATQTGVLYTFKGTNPLQSELQNRWSGSVTIDSNLNNSNEIQLVVYASDNAGNAGDSSQSGSKGYCVVKIDTTAPDINVFYDNNNAESGVYFKNDRVATISITERNFDPNDVNISIENTEGVIPAVSGWSVAQGSYNGDDTVNTATITYSADGDYKFNISYTDLAGNSASSASFANGTVAGSEFTIDKTQPAVYVSYNNNSAQNGNYYNADRIATITVNEHNFNASLVNISVSASDDGASISAPAMSGWVNNGDVHTTTINYNIDGLYKFDIAVKDMAANDAVDYDADSFYIDKTAPVVKIDGVKNESANKGDCIPIVNFSDTNIDMSKISMTLTGINRKAVEIEGEYSDIRNGTVFTFKNFAKEKQIDDIYTLVGAITDKAGNTAKSQINFSVNRFGSTYEMSEGTEKINGSYTNTPVDLVISEINANELSNISITVFRSGQTIVLKKNKDFKVDVTGGNGKWYKYVYTIFKDVFENDGVYQITIHSEDAAGNIAENNLDTKEMNLSFGIDKTLPSINIKNIESNTTYPVDSITVLVSATDNLKLQSLTIYLDSVKVANWEGNELLEIINRGDDFSFDISGTSAKAHNLRCVATDSAGNSITENVNDFYVTTSIVIRYITNRPLFVGSIIGLVFVVLLVVFLITRKKRSGQPL